MAKTARIQVAFEPHDYELIKRLAGLQDQSMSAVVGDLFDSVSPVLERVCVVLEAAKKAKENAHSGIKEQAERIEQEMQPLINAALDQFDMFASFVETAQQRAGDEHSDKLHPAKPSKSARTGAREGSQPPHSNTGVRSRKAPILRVPKVPQKARPSSTSKGVPK
jgi:hypothetical protein